MSDPLTDIPKYIDTLQKKLVELSSLYESLDKTNLKDKSIAIDDIKEDLDFLHQVINDINSEYNSLTPIDKSNLSVMRKLKEKISFLEESLNSLAWRMISLCDGKKENMQ